MFDDKFIKSQHQICAIGAEGEQNVQSVVWGGYKLLYIAGAPLCRASPNLNGFSNGNRSDFTQMIEALKRTVHRVIQRFAVGSELEYSCRSYSQEGEDRVLDRYFGYREPGFYIDVGAHHPHRFSNTHLFYKRGWRGINIDAMPDSMAPFRRLRQRDINLEVGVGEVSGTAKFFVFNEPALNTFDEMTAKAHTRPGWHILRTVDVTIEPLSVILERHLPPEVEIDLLSIDVEGYELAVLKSNNWIRFRPEIILVESLGKDLSRLQTNETALFLKTVGYVPYAKTVNTLFFTQEKINKQ